MLVTDLDLCAGRAIEETVARAIAGGVNAVQLRAPGLPARDLLGLAQSLRHIIQPPALLIINDRLDVALACAADGVQLGERSLPVAQARQLAPTLLLGASVHDQATAQAAVRDGADYLIVGTMFPTHSHPGKVPEGISLLHSIRSHVAVPLVGIGGITSHNLPAVMNAGANGAAVISSIMIASDPAVAARALLECM